VVDRREVREGEAVGEGEGEGELWRSGDARRWGEVVAVVDAREWLVDRPGVGVSGRRGGGD